MSQSNQQQEDQLKEIGFHPLIRTWFQNHFEQPSPPQRKGWPVIAARKHTLILAPTGSGKTLAAFLWCLDDLFKRSLVCGSEVFDKNSAGFHTVYISPLKALNNDIERNLHGPLKQIKKTADHMAIAFPDIRVHVRSGDTPPHLRQMMLKKPPHILITTPESLYLLLTSEKARGLFAQVQNVIVDEIHAMCNNKRGVHFSLSLERLTALSSNEPVRIGLSATQKPLQRIAAFLGGQCYTSGAQSPIARPVEIIDCGHGRKMDLKVISPVADFTNLPEASVWPFVVAQIYDLIRAHRTCLIFVNMRAQTEKIARWLNEMHVQNTGMKEEIARAHHGSLSRETRYTIEHRLKSGLLPAVVATASLELGIDVGTIDLVILLESPKSLISAVQRIGRSGHALTGTSKGRFIPLYAADIDDAMAITRAVLRGEIEETSIAQNCLDVLAQHVVAEVAMRDWDRKKLYQLFRQSYCYQDLSLREFDSVLNMLTGRYEHEIVNALHPRLDWDQVHDRLIAVKGSRLTSVLGGGTIPDRGYFGVFLQDKNVRLGEVEEEFVFESRVGDVFYLGSTEWKIEQIRNDRIVVVPTRSSRPRAPFWKGELLYRDVETQSHIAVFRDWVIRSLSDNQEQVLRRELQPMADTAAIDGLINVIKKQMAHSRICASHHQIVVESFRDQADVPFTVIHAPFGGRVNGAWAVVLHTLLEQKFHLQSQYDYNDDGIILRLFGDSKLNWQEMLQFLSKKVKEILQQNIMDTTMFSVAFRFNATRALLLQRSRAGKRIPLWLQRLRSADLLQVVRHYKDFPVVVETIRECLYDLFDLKALEKILQNLETGEINIAVVQSISASPMAKTLMFRFLSQHMYEYDRARFPSKDQNQLAEQALEGELPAHVQLKDALEMHDYLQYLTEDQRAKNKQQLYRIIEELGPIHDAALKDRTAIDPAEWLLQLQDEKRIQKSDHFWIAASMDAVLKSDQPDNIIIRISRVLQKNAPITITQIQSLTGIPGDIVQPYLERFLIEKRVIFGNLISDQDGTFWCDRTNYMQLLKRAVYKRRVEHNPLEQETLVPFLLAWHGVSKKKFKSLQACVEHYQGFYFPVGFFEREILRTRFDDTFMKSLDLMQQSVRDMEIIPRVLGVKTFRIQYIIRAQGHIFFDKQELTAKVDPTDDAFSRVADFLLENGSSQYKDICAATALDGPAVDDALAGLLRAGLVGCNNYSLLQHMVKQGKARIHSPNRLNERNGRPSRAQVQERVDVALEKEHTSWFFNSNFLVLGHRDESEDKCSTLYLPVLKQCRLLLQRYGVLIKAWYRQENGLMPWYPIFQALKRLEWQGEVRRGYFIDGLSGIQFALPSALELLAQPSEMKSRLMLVSTLDPALPFGRSVDWQIFDQHDVGVKITRLDGNHLCFWGTQPVCYSENWGKKLILLRSFDPDHAAALAFELQVWLRLPFNIRPRKRLEIWQIDGRQDSRDVLIEACKEAGWEWDGQKLVLWPSRVQV